MRYVIWAKSPDSAPFRHEGRWVVEASSREEAARLMETQIKLWPKDSTWTIRPWTADDVKTSERRSNDANPVSHPLIGSPPMGNLYHSNLCSVTLCRKPLRHNEFGSTLVFRNRGLGSHP